MDLNLHSLTHLYGVIIHEARGQLCLYVDMKHAFLYYKGRTYEWNEVVCEQSAELDIWAYEKETKGSRVKWQTFQNTITNLWAL